MAFKALQTIILVSIVTSIICVIDDASVENSNGNKLTEWDDSISSNINNHFNSDKNFELEDEFEINPVLNSYDSEQDEDELFLKSVRKKRALNSRDSEQDEDELFLKSVRKKRAAKDAKDEQRRDERATLSRTVLENSYRPRHRNKNCEFFFKLKIVCFTSIAF